LDSIWKYDIPLPRINILLPFFPSFAHTNSRGPGDERSFSQKSRNLAIGGG
jgi:hypothetical protein